MKRAKTGLASVLVALLAGWAATAPTASPTPPREINVTNDPTYAWGEQQIVINPRNPNNIAIATVGVTLCENDPRPDCKQVPSTFYPPVPGLPAAFRGNRAVGFYENPDFTAVVVFYSFDRGRTWKRSRLPKAPVGFPTLFSQGDPAIAAGPDGTFYVSWDANDWGTPEKTLPRAGVGISMSKDGGKTWSPPVLTGTPVDAPKLAVDHSTRTIYGASSSFRGPRSTGNPDLPLDPTSDRWLAMSKDGVKWTETQGMGGFGSQMAAAHGVFATIFTTSPSPGPFSPANNQLCGSEPAPCTIFQTSRDAGRSWSRHVLPIKLTPGANPGGPGTAPMIAADPTKPGRYSVGVAMNKDSEFHVVTTEDYGKSWGTPVVVSQDKAKTHYFAVMSYSPKGVLGMAWHTRLAAGGGGFGAPSAPFNIWAAISRDKGKTFSAAVKVSTMDSPGGNSSGDDYSGIALDGEYLYATWADWRTKTRQNFMGVVPFTEFK